MSIEVKVPDLGDGIDSGYQGKLCETVNAFHIFSRDVSFRGPIGNVATKFDFMVGGIEDRQLVHTTAASQDLIPHPGNFPAKRGDNTDTRDDNTSLHKNLSRSVGRFQGQRCKPLCSFHTQTPYTFLAVAMLFDVIDCLTHRLDLLSSIIGNADVEFFFQLHDQFNGIQGVGT